MNGPSINELHLSNNFFDTYRRTGAGFSPPFDWGTDPYNPGGWTINRKVQHIWNQVKVMFSSQPSSPSLDKGLRIAGYHCERADDDPLSPMSPSDSCRHWRGLAPDPGPFEKG